MPTKNFKLSAILIVFFSTLLVSAQKSAPVAGDAAILIDLLKKDYNSVSPETRADEILRDRAKTVAIFKSYSSKTVSVELATDSLTKHSLIAASSAIYEKIWNLQGLNHDKLKSGRDSFSMKEVKYNKSKKKLTDLKSLNSGNSSIILKNFNDFEKGVADSEKEYLESRYYYDSHSLLNLYIAYNKNSYIKYVIKQFIKKYNYLQFSKTDVFAAANHQSSIQKSLPFLGGDLAFETIIDGLSRFLAKRIKEELTTHVVDKIKQNLENPRPQSYLNELMVLLPVTTDYIKSFEADQVLNFVDEIKQYIEDDLNHLLENASQLKNTPRFKNLIAKNPDLDFAFEALEIYPQLSKIKNPVDYFDMLDNSRNISRWSELKENKSKYNIANSLRLASMIAHSLTVLENSELKFVSTDFMGNYGSETNFYYLYIGFLSQQNIKYFDLKFFTKTSKIQPLMLQNLMTMVQPSEINEVKSKVTFINRELTRITTYAEKIHNDALAIKKAKNKSDSISIQDVHSFIAGIIDFAQQITISSDRLLVEIENPKCPADILSLKTSIETQTTPYFKTARISNDIMLDLHNKKYSTAIIKALEIPSNFANSQLSMHKILNIQNDIKKSSSLMLLGDILRYKKLPNKTDEIDELKTALTYLEATIQRKKRLLEKDEYQTNVPYLDTIGIKVTDILKKLDMPQDDMFKNDISELEKIVESGYVKLLKYLADIDISKKILAPIDSAMVKIEYDSTKISETKEAVKKHIGLTIKTVLVNGKIELEDLLEDEEYIESKKKLRRIIQAYLPEIAGNVFKIKDKNLIKTIHFVNDIALSENAGDVEAAIDAFALPSGSYSLKKKPGHYVSVNSFPGILLGIENSKGRSGAFALGFTAPVGLYTKLGGKFGLFAPIIDIAAPIRFRFDNDNSTKTLPEFSFKNILSPGLYVTLTPWKSPLTFNLGAQYGPELEVINNDDTVTKLDNSFRIGLGVTLDIPLITLFNRPK